MVCGFTGSLNKAPPPKRKSAKIGFKIHDQMRGERCTFNIEKKRRKRLTNHR